MTTPPINLVSVTTPATPQEPTNPYYVQAKGLAAANDVAGLQALDAYLAEAGYSPDGIVRSFISQALGG